MRAEEAPALRLSEDLSAVVVSEKRNNLLGRTEYVLAIHHAGRGTPPLAELRALLAKVLRVEIERLYIRRLLTEYGAAVSRATVHVYDDAQLALKIEPEHVVRRNAERSKRA